MIRNPELHAAVLAAPDDDAPRMVYADWLIERGDPRGEWIVLQLQPQTPAALDRMSELSLAHEAEWNAPYELLTVSYSRGFVTYVDAQVDSLARAADDAFADACVRELILRAWNAADPCPELVRRAPAMALRALDLYAPVVPDRFADVLAAPALASLARLAVHHRAALLAAVSARRDNLRALEASRCDVDRDLLARIGERTALTDLHLANNPLGAGAAALLRGPIERLDLAHTGLGADDIAPLAELPLRSLVLTGNPIGPAGARRLAGDPRFAGVRVLELGGCGIGEDGVAALIASPYLRRDLELSLDGALLHLRPEPFLVEGIEISRAWYGTPRADLAARFESLKVFD